MAMIEEVANHHYFDHGFDVAAVKLLPNQYYVTDKEMLLTTVLGSCIAVCMSDRIAGVGGMNHFMLPDLEQRSDDGKPSPVPTRDMRYGTYAMQVLLEQLMKAGAQRERLEVKVFGGGAVLDNMRALNIGERNSEFILRYLRNVGIPVAAQDLGGNFPRRVLYFPKSGVTMVRTLRRKNDLQLVQTQEIQEISDTRKWLIRTQPAPFFVAKQTELEKYSGGIGSGSEK
ncbi:chemoreceptor glutamine deamidase CheD [Glaciimonas soli]|nr:chemoreceptor glutamine deamidase CheD [Glaciimonas soli]